MKDAIIQWLIKQLVRQADDPYAHLPPPPKDRELHPLSDSDIGGFLDAAEWRKDEELWQNLLAFAAELGVRNPWQAKKAELAILWLRSQATRQGRKIVV